VTGDYNTSGRVGKGRDWKREKGHSAAETICDNSTGMRGVERSEFMKDVVRSFSGTVLLCHVVVVARHSSRGGETGNAQARSERAERMKGPQAREAAICWSCTTEDQVERSSVRSRSLEAWLTTSFPSPRLIASLVAICTCIVVSKIGPHVCTNKPQTHLTVLGGTGHAPGFIFRPGKDDDSVENLNVGNMGTVVEEALCVQAAFGQTK